MNISPKTHKDPVSEIKFMDGGFRCALQAAEEVAGKQGVKVVLTQSGLSRLIDNYPESLYATSGKYTCGEYAQFNVGLLNFFGRGGRSMVLRIGRLSQEYGTEQTNSLLGNAVLGALHLIPEGARLKKGLELMKYVFERTFTYEGRQTMGMQVEERGDKLAFVVETCACCCGFTSDVPICYTWVGMLQEGLRGTFGKDREVDVKEVECRAMGAPACVFEMSKVPPKS